MKKFLFLAGFAAFAFACGGADGSKTSADSATTKPETPAVAAPANDEKAIELIAGSDCLTCHKVNEKVIGPSYIDVAKKYTASDAVIAELAGKVINGGTGVWGTIPMTPHPQISQEDAKTMVTYILSLKNQ